MRLYRVFPYLSSAAPDKPGGALHISPLQGAGRIDNPELYRTRYASTSPAGACAEAFTYGDYRTVWSEALLRGAPSLPGSVRALAWLELRAETKICDLDDPKVLTRNRLRPSQVVTRERTPTQRWARDIFASGLWHGLSWWSYHDARWTSVALWRQDAVQAVGVELLTLQHTAITEAARILSIRIH